MVIGGANKPKPEFGSVWFLGNKPIKVCIEQESGFPFSKEEVTSTFKGAFHQWVNYIIERKAEDWSRGERPKDAKYITKEILLQSNCDDQTELTLTLGFDTRNDIQNDSKALSEPISYANRVSYDLENGRGKGYIWISKQHEFWKRTSHKDDGLYAIFLHELGHVFGVPHIHGTIMSDSFIGNLISYFTDDFYFEQARKIDHYNSVKGSSISYGLFDTHPKRVKETFKFMTGSEPDGEVYCKWAINDQHTKITFTIWDKTQEYHFDMNAPWENYDASLLSTNGQSIFKTYYKPKEITTDIWRYFNDQSNGPTSDEYVFKSESTQKEFKVIGVYQSQIREALTTSRTSEDEENKDPKFANYPYQLFVQKGREFERICGPSYYYVRTQDYW